MFEQINHLALIGELMQQMCVYLVVAYLLSKTPLFAPLMQVTVRLPDKPADHPNSLRIHKPHEWPLHRIKPLLHLAVASPCKEVLHERE